MIGQPVSVSVVDVTRWLIVTVSAISGLAITVAFLDMRS